MCFYYFVILYFIVCFILFIMLSYLLCLLLSCVLLCFYFVFILCVFLLLLLQLFYFYFYYYLYLFSLLGPYPSLFLNPFVMAQIRRPCPIYACFPKSSLAQSPLGPNDLSPKKETLIAQNTHSPHSTKPYLSQDRACSSPNFPLTQASRPAHSSPNRALTLTFLSFFTAHKS